MPAVEPVVVRENVGASAALVGVDADSGLEGLQQAFPFMGRRRGAPERAMF